MFCFFYQFYELAQKSAFMAGARRTTCALIYELAQKSAFMAKAMSSFFFPLAALAYVLTLFSKKLSLFSSEMRSMKENGFVEHQIFG